MGTGHPFPGIVRPSVGCPASGGKLNCARVHSLDRRRRKARSDHLRAEPRRCGSLVSSKGTSLNRTLGVGCKRWRRSTGLGSRLAFEPESYLLYLRPKLAAPIAVSSADRVLDDLSLPSALNPAWGPHGPVSARAIACEPPLEDLDCGTVSRLGLHGRLGDLTVGSRQILAGLDLGQGSPASLLSVDGVSQPLTLHLFLRLGTRCLCGASRFPV